MTVQAHTADRRLVVLAVLGVVLALTAAMWTLAGCAPKAEPSAPAASEQNTIIHFRRLLIEEQTTVCRSETCINLSVKLLIYSLIFFPV